MLETMALILAAGEGTRMKSKKHKVLHPLCGKPMIDYSLDVCTSLGVEKPVVVVGYHADDVKEYVGDRAVFAFQDRTTGKGTGHAVLSAASYLDGKEGCVFVMAGDMPLLDADALIRMRDPVLSGKASAVMMTAELEDPTGYGRVIKDQNGNVTGIVEQKDLAPGQEKIRQINSLVFCFSIPDLLEALPHMTNHNSQGEYYLNDVISIFASSGKKVLDYNVPAWQSLGFNDRIQLSRIEKILRTKINEKHMANGVTIIDPDSVYIESGVSIGQDTVLYPGCVLTGNTVIGEDCVIRGTSRLENACIGSRVEIESSVLLNCSVDDDTTVGPFAYLRPDSRVGKNVKVGDFVELKNAVIGDGTKISHLTYVGDADLGKDINLGCGTVFVNYDGKYKYRSTVGDHAFIGCNVNLVAPVHVGDGAFIAAGSTVTKDVPSDSLVVARQRETVKEGWAAKRREEGKLK
ncbi:MAG: bifunctional UDP-N-acetylglucosamine diphosphorylase/glucosamine-1-phosphate N-acetyltransferase GlmU [Clostridia bacterium]|nr:bifunctional UDP-N-acetylglucosamine diphosphorylase/glucosamine-1-phosphate N-acetyltransferase GlmU [Clostridia bacterium]